MPWRECRRRRRTVPRSTNEIRNIGYTLTSSARVHFYAFIFQPHSNLVVVRVTVTLGKPYTKPASQERDEIVKLSVFFLKNLEVLSVLITEGTEGTLGPVLKVA